MENEPQSVWEPQKRYQQRLHPQWARALRHSPPFLPIAPRATERQKLGLRYERRVHERLLDRFGLRYIPGQWFSFGLPGPDGGVRYCQLDGILLDDERRVFTIIEFKYSHTANAYWQIENTYVPVIACFLRQSGWQIATCEVVKWYDPSVRFPRPVALRDDVSLVKPGEFAVHILNRE